MANVQYDQGVPFAEPAATPPQDYQHIEAQPAEFGGLIAQGEGRLGEGATTAVKFYSQIAAQQAVGDWQDQANKTLTSFKKLRGQDAMAAQPDVLQNLKDAEAEGAANLATPDAQLNFTQNIRYLRARYEAEVGAHYDQQAQVWGVGVNESAATQHLQDIEAGTVRGDLGLVNSAATGLVSSRLKQAELLYGTLTSDMAEGVRTKAFAESIETQIKALTPTDPARAARILDANKDKLPAPVYEQLSRQTKAYGDAVGLTSNVQGYLSGPAPAGVAPGGGTPAPLNDAVRQRAQTVHDEAVRQGAPDDEGWGIAANAVHESGATAAPLPGDGGISHGMFQLNKDQLAAYRASHNGHMPEQDDAATQIAFARKQAAPYLGGASGPDGYAAAYTRGFEVPAGGESEVANRAATAMALSGKQPAIELASAAGTQPPVASPAVALHNPAGVDRLAQLYLGAPAEAMRLYPNNAVLQQQFVRESRQNVNELMMLQNRDVMERERARKEAAEGAGQQVLGALVKNPTQFDPKTIWNIPDNVMTWEEKQHLSEVANYQLAQGGVDTTKHGPGYAKVFSGITGNVSDPNAVPINSMRDIWSRAGQGGDLTLRDADTLSQVYAKVHKDPDEASLRLRESSMLTYAKRRLTFPDVQVAPGMQITDRIGEDIFNAQFVQAYTQQLDKAVATGKPDEINNVLSKDYVDKLAGSMRSQRDIDQARLEATGMAPDEATVEKPGTPIPAAPQGLNAGEWSRIMTLPPTVKGVPYSHQAWATVLQRLTANPVQGVKDFNERFGAAGYDGQQILERLKSQAPPAAQWTVGPNGEVYLAPQAAAPTQSDAHDMPAVTR